MLGDFMFNSMLPCGQRITAIEPDLFNHIKNGQYSIDLSQCPFSELGIKVMNQMLRFDLNLRYDSIQILCDPYFISASFDLPPVAVNAMTGCILVLNT